MSEVWVYVRTPKLSPSSVLRSTTSRCVRAHTLTKEHPYTGAVTETRVERKERTRRSILDAALRLLEDTSLVALSLRQVAKEVGVVPTAFYRHFDSIEVLGLELVEESFDSLRAVLRDVRRGDPALDDIVDNSVRVLVEHVQGQSQHFAFIVRERSAGPAPVRVAIRQGIELFQRELATDIAHLPGTVGWSSEDLRVVATLIVNAMVATAEALLVSANDAEVAATAQSARTQLRMVLVGAVNWRSKG